MRHQTIDEPIPMVGRLDHYTGEFLMEWLQLSENRRQFVGKRRCRKTRSFWSSTANTLLLECRSIAA